MTLHTDIPTRSTLEWLLGTQGEPCVSIYLETTPLTQETQGARIALKNLTAEAAGQLEAAGEDRTTIAALREELGDLADDDEFWVEQSHSLAIFFSSHGLRTFRLPNRLRDAVEVGDRFYVQPLLRAVTFPQAAFVLALATGSVRLVEVAADDPPFAVDVPGLPKDAASAAGKRSITERSPIGRLQGSEGQKVRMRQYARKVDQALRGVLAGLELPLILAAAEPLASIYRSLNSYPHLVEPGLTGNPEGASEAELAVAARAVLDQVYAGELAETRALFELRSGHGRAETDVAQVARMATYGAVDTVFVDIDEKLPGLVDEASGAVRLAEDDAVSYGVVDEIARRVLLFGGRVLAVRRPDVPGDGPVAAILRYAL